MTRKMTRKEIATQKCVASKIGNLLVLSKYASQLTSRSGELLKIQRKDDLFVIEMILPIGLELGVWEVKIEFNLKKHERFQCEIAYPDYWVEVQGCIGVSSPTIKNYKDFDDFIDRAIQMEESLLKIISEKSSDVKD